jgi:hypothetical protein
LTEEEMSIKTWVFLDENRIKWGEYDEDLSDKKQSMFLMQWCSQLIKDTEENFAKFYNNF